MAALNAVIVPAKVLKGGRHKIRIAVSHNGETRYIVTDIVIDSEREFKNGAVVRRPDAAIKNTTIRGLLDRYTNAMSEIEYIHGMTCPELVTYLKDGYGHTKKTLEDVYSEYIKVRDLKDSSKVTYRTYWKIIARSIRPDSYVSNLTRANIVKLITDTRKYATATAYGVLILMSTLLNYCQTCGYARFTVSPMRGIEYPKPGVRNVWLTTDEIKKIRDLKTNIKSLARFRDFFMLSYYLGGINAIDLIKINFKECGNTLRYVRTKSEKVVKINEYVEFQIPEEAKEIITRLMDENGMLKVTKTERRTQMGNLFTRGSIKMQEVTGIKKIIYYSARKSFAQHAFELGVRDPVINYILGHKLDTAGKRVTFAYLYVTPQMATEAIRKVLDNLK